MIFANNYSLGTILAYFSLRVRSLIITEFLILP